MRFCMVTTFYPPFSYGGDATYVRALSRSLVAHGHEVDVIASTDAYLVRSAADPAKVEPDDEDGVRVHRLRHPMGFAAQLLTHQTGTPGLYGSELRRLLDRDYDVLHFHNISLMGGPAVLAMGNPRVRLYSLHEHWLICPTHIFWKNGERACDRPTCFSCSIKSGLPPQLWRYTGLRDRYLRKPDRIFAPSAYTARRHHEMGVRQPIEVLPLFSSIEPDASVRHAPDSDRPTLLFVGRVVASKGIEQLARVVADMPDIDLKIIGDGDLRGSLLSRYGSHPNIRFLGAMPQPELIRHYATATALVFPSIAPETFGLAVVEAAACGTPSIVAAGSGGAAEIVTTGGSGLIFASDEELAQCIRQLASTPALREKLGKQARARFEALYTREHHIQSYLAHVDQLMAARKAAS
jgi:glycosyltransferase involved in cell wall biosynthesis